MIAPAGLQATLSRISAVQQMASSLKGGFAGALGTAMADVGTTEAVAATTVRGQTDTTGTPSTAPVGEPPSGAGRWQASIDRAANAAGIEPALLTAVVWTESGFQPDAVSHAGAIGLAQLMPGTAELLGVDPYDPEQNLAGGARFLRSMIDRFGRVDLALAAYNAGPARVAELHDGGPGVPVSHGYVTTVLDRHRALGGTA
jgi:soluble lytic murein transglycosylase-like protein